jgi:hypothetical protein
MGNEGANSGAENAKWDSEAETELQGATLGLDQCVHDLRNDGAGQSGLLKGNELNSDVSAGF